MISNPVIPTTTSGVSLLQQFLPLAIRWGFVIGVIVFFFMFLIGAISWIASGGDKGKVESAKAKISGAFIGLIVLFSIFVIIKLIGVVFKIELLNLTLPTIGTTYTSPVCDNVKCDVFPNLTCIPDLNGGHCGQ